MKTTHILLSAIFTAYTLCASAQTIVTLPQLFELAESQSGRITVTKSSLEAAGEALATAKNAILPTINLSLSENYIGNATLTKRNFSTSGTTDVIVAGLGPQKVSNGRQDTPHWGNSLAVHISQVIYAGGAISSSIRQAELGQEAASLDIDRERQEVRLLLAGYYLDLYKLYNQREVIRKNIDLTRQTISLMEARHKQGSILKSDITRYELQLENLILTEVKLQESIDVINNQITSMLHLAADVSIQPDTATFQKESAIPGREKSLEEWLYLADEHNLNILISDLGTELATQRIKSTRAASLPSVSIIAADQLFGPYTNDLISVNANVNTWFIGVGVNYNLSSLWHNKRAINRSRIEARQSREKASLFREEIQNKVFAQYTHLNTAITELQRQQKQLELAQQNYNVMKRKYENGLALVTELTDAANLQLSAEIGLVDARVAILYNYYQLRYFTSSL